MNKFKFFWQPSWL